MEDMDIDATEKTPAGQGGHSRIETMRKLHSLVWGLVDSETIYKKVYHEETIKVHSQLGFEHTFCSPQRASQPQHEAPSLEEGGEAIVKIIDLTEHPSHGGEDPEMPIQNWRTDRIVVVPAYEELERETYRSNERYIEFTNKTAKERNHLIPPRNIILTGIPGICKSFAQNYLLFKRLSERKITAYQPFWEHRSGYYLFSENGVLFVSAGSTGKDNEYHLNREIWALVDDDPLPEFSNVWERNWMVVLTASPGRYSTSRWAKEQVVNTFYMRPWTWEEIEVLSCRKDLYSHRLRWLFARYGGVPRTLTESIFLGEDDRDRFIQSIERFEETVSRQIRALVHSSQTLSAPDDILLTPTFPRVIHMIPGVADIPQSFEQTFFPRFATVYMEQRVADHVISLRRTQLHSFYQSMMEVPSLKPAAGRMFEKLAHEYFFRRRGSKVSFGEAEDPTKSPIHPSAGFTIKRGEEFRELKALGDTFHDPHSQKFLEQRKNIYYQPLKTNQTALDSLAYVKFGSEDHLLLFQMTVAGKHPVKEAGIESIRNILPNEAKKVKHVHLIFVVPNGSTLKLPQPYEPNGASPWNGHVKQRILRLSEEQLYEGRNKM